MKRPLVNEKKSLKAKNKKVKDNHYLDQISAIFECYTDLPNDLINEIKQYILPPPIHIVLKSFFVQVRRRITCKLSCSRYDHYYTDRWKKLCHILKYEQKEGGISTDADEKNLDIGKQKTDFFTNVIQGCTVDHNKSLYLRNGGKSILEGTCKYQPQRAGGTYINRRVKCLGSVVLRHDVIDFVFTPELWPPKGNYHAMYDYWTSEEVNDLIKSIHKEIWRYVLQSDEIPQFNVNVAKNLDRENYIKQIVSISN